MKGAREREEMDSKGKGTGGNFWRSVGGVVHCAEAGLRKEATERHTAPELERRIGKYVGRALGSTNRVDCGCRCEDEEMEKERERKRKGKEKERDFEREMEVEREREREQENQRMRERERVRARQDEQNMWSEPKYRLSVPSTVASHSTSTSTTASRFSAIDQEKRMGFMVPVQENWPLRV